jgi:hypothetical protein
MSFIKEDVMPLKLKSGFMVSSGAGVILLMRSDFSRTTGPNRATDLCRSAAP